LSNLSLRAEHIFVHISHALNGKKKPQSLAQIARVMTAEQTVHDVHHSLSANALAA
jgi:prephenate dehydratase